MVSRQRRWQLNQIKNGHCPKCGKVTGVHRECDICYKKRLTMQRARYYRIKAQ